MTARASDRVKPQDIGSDLIRAIRHCDEKKLTPPKFIIYEPDEVPMIPGEIAATLTRKLKEVCSTVVDLREHVTSFKLQHGKVPQGSDVYQTKPTYSVILK